MSRPPVEQSARIGQGSAIGRPRKEPPPDAARVIERLAAEGRSVVGIAHHFGTSKNVLGRWLKEYEPLSDAFAAGREQERHELHQIMMRDARDGEKPNINAMFLLKTRHGYREGDAQADNGPRVVINLPGAMSREDFMKTVTVEAGDGG